MSETNGKAPAIAAYARGLFLKSKPITDKERIAALEAELATVKRAKANNDQHLDHYYAEVRRLREELAASQATIAKMRVWRSKNEQTD